MKKVFLGGTCNGSDWRVDVEFSEESGLTDEEYAEEVKKDEEFQSAMNR